MKTAKGNSIKKTTTILLAVVMLASLAVVSGPEATQAAVRTRGTDVTTPGAGNVFVKIRGNFFTEKAETILKKINDIRYEACEEGVPNPSGGTLTLSDYVPIKWASELEWIAQTRAAEASVLMDHQRPNGDMCFGCTHNNESSWAENLAWNYSGIMMGIDQWYDEKDDWVNQNSKAVTGHYTSLIDPYYQYIGIGCFRLNAGGYYSVSAEFSFMSGLEEKQIGVSGLYDQTIEVPKSEAESYKKYSGSEERKQQNKTAKPKATKITKLTAAKKAFTVKWKKKSGVTGYQIQYSLKSNFKKAKKLTVKGAKTVSKKIKGLKKKRTYYVRVRTYKKSVGYSAWSAVRKIKTK